MMVQGGMSPHQALKAGTINGARALGLDKDVGSLEVGKLADLVVLDRNPLENIRDSTSIRYVMANGRVYDSNMDEVVSRNRPRAKFWFEQAGGEAWSRGAGETVGVHADGD
jgi:cytosine/adenosine deaminase-related metal-dependent hydrolase